MMKRILTAVIVAATVLIIPACKKGDESGAETGTDIVNGFDKNAMLRHYADSLILPGYTRLQDELGNLNTATEAFLGAPSATAQQAVRTAYAKAYRAYERVAAYQFGPAEETLLDLYLNFSGGLDYNFNTAGTLTGFSVDTAGIDSMIRTGNPPQLAAISRQSFYTQGYGALGYLLFGTEAITGLQGAAQPARAAYIRSLTGRMSTLVAQVQRKWNAGYRAEFVANTRTNVGSPIGNLVNQFAYQLDLLKGPRIGWPFGKQSNGMVFATKTEGFHAGISAALAAENLRALRNTFTAGASGKGISGYLVALGQAQLNTDVLAQFDAAIARVEAIPDPLSATLTTQPALVDAAYKEVQKLLTLLKTDVASATAVQITFMDNDGD